MGKESDVWCKIGRVMRVVRGDCRPMARLGKSDTHKINNSRVILVFSLYSSFHCNRHVEHLAVVIVVVILVIVEVILVIVVIEEIIVVIVVIVVILITSKIYGER